MRERPQPHEIVRQSVGSHAALPVRREGSGVLLDQVQLFPLDTLLVVEVYDDDLQPREDVEFVSRDRAALVLVEHRHELFLDEAHLGSQ